MKNQTDKPPVLGNTERLALEILLLLTLLAALLGLLVTYRMGYVRGADAGYTRGVDETTLTEFYRGVYAACYQFTMMLSGGLEGETIQACAEVVSSGSDLEVHKWDYPGWPLGMGDG